MAGGRVWQAARVTDDRNTGAYHEVFADLSGIYLEDSWVLEIHHDDAVHDDGLHGDALVFVLDAVLTPDHQAYRPPEADEQYCYRRALLRISADSAIVLRRSGLPPTVDPTGESDYGNIDSFRAVPGELPPLWELSGDWGEAIVRGPRVELRLEADAEPRSAASPGRPSPGGG
jgi:hypothetical protein